MYKPFLRLQTVFEGVQASTPSALHTSHIIQATLRVIVKEAKALQILFPTESLELTVLPWISQSNLTCFNT